MKEFLRNSFAFIRIFIIPIIAILFLIIGNWDEIKESRNFFAIAPPAASISMEDTISDGEENESWIKENATAIGVILIIFYILTLIYFN